MALNYIVLMGRLTADTELRTVSGDINTISFSIAVDKLKSKSNPNPQANFIRCVAWRGTAELINQFFKKGSRIIIEGSLQTRVYEDKNGVKREIAEVLVENFNFVDKKAESTVASAEEDEPLF